MPSSFLSFHHSLLLDHHYITMAPPVLKYFRSHLFERLPSSNKSFAGLTIVITGANSGLGLEAARQFVQQDAAKVILAVRDHAKGEAAKTSIIESTKKPKDIVEVWALDLCSSASIESFSSRIHRDLDRLDVVVANAGVLTHKFELVEGCEKTLTVNVINTFLMALLVLPKLRETATRLNRETVLTFTGSLVHWLARFSQREDHDGSGGILAALSNEKTADMGHRYVLSKLLMLLAYRELAKAVSRSTKPGEIVVSMANPGSVRTALDRENHGPRSWVWTGFVNIVGRSAEEGSRVLLHAAEGGRETHGQYLDDCKIGRFSDFVESPAGLVAQEQVWSELVALLEQKHPSIMQNV
ncbi:putative short-chain dehydrogenase/reductase family protein [Xylariaceae sp. FL1019]|nr:putative short-chain dehydrogenase/reductase family protein [Xylariaceae sp. FL1019]